MLGAVYSPLIYTKLHRKLQKAFSACYWAVSAPIRTYPP